ncbi:uncharacterized protein PFL1_05550 [Pseudozyma flocculosa PF-1]|uniref:Dynactin subunit 6 n=2 Tax=Pseudozyma flocculosa TaxID=84751 RepID=A0A5C3F9Q6_9BASI|nr:uncharacterized protein PFL1_05550 [Pseudozyma flocculosa PF-1]EPQ26915.1 hypothetical protein PFL1_05550 [Pseudozyma flocculosa PF-1]SPO41178.1 related to Dynactin 6 [Pseudozyma flocculosa]
MAPPRDRLTVGSRVVIAQDAELRGEISIGSGTVIHPRAVVYAQQGPISIGSNCIIEEMAAIVNRRPEPMQIGDDNLFEVGSRIEAAGVGSSNTFQVRCKVASTIRVGSYCNIGAGCSVVPTALWPRNIEDLFGDDDDDDDQEHGDGEPGGKATAAKDEDGEEARQASAASADEAKFESLPDRTVVFGHSASRRQWSGEGVKQQAALHAKHLEYLRDMIPKAHKLKIIQAVRAPSPSRGAQ